LNSGGQDWSERKGESFAGGKKKEKAKCVGGKKESSAMERQGGGERKLPCNSEE